MQNARRVCRKKTRKQTSSQNQPTGSLNKNNFAQQLVFENDADLSTRLTARHYQGKSSVNRQGRIQVGRLG